MFHSWFFVPNGKISLQQRQRQAEEQDRLRKIQEALELERKQKEAEERTIREEEENRRKYVTLFKWISMILSNTR